jgi:hypothetical protein
MGIFHCPRLRKVRVGLLIFIVICGITYRIVLKRSEKFHSVSTTKDPKDPHHNSSECHTFNPQVTPQDLFHEFFSLVNDSSWLKKPATYSPSFEELHGMLFGTTAPNLYEAWPNHFKVKINPSYPHTSLTQPLFSKILKEVSIPVIFIVEVGSFMGKSAINIAQTRLTSNSTLRFVLLCIDTWLGGFEHWVLDELRQMMDIRYGRPIVYEQFIANIIGNNLTNYIIPYSTTSILGARFLIQKKLFPQIVYLDSAHLEGETYVELELYWLLIQDGGVLIGDDWGWPSVRCDVLLFTAHNKVNVTVIGSTWYIKKEKKSSH